MNTVAAWESIEWHVLFPDTSMSILSLCYLMACLYSYLADAKTSLTMAIVVVRGTHPTVKTVTVFVHKHNLIS